MFYSHEILTNRQYGVATIWLVATIGNRSASRKVTRKAIQEVDVQKACGKISEPGAPVALRLQGHLLYGVSRVYSQQCAYMLADVQKIQMHMHLFFKSFGSNELDSDAGQARPENLLITNDPDFFPDERLPQFDLNALVAGSQVTNKTSSQMSPPNTLLSGASMQGIDFPVRLNLQHSDSLGPLSSPFGLRGLSSSQKPDSGEIFPQQDDELASFGDWGMEIDEHGNVIEFGEPAIAEGEPDLPPLRRRHGVEVEADAEQQVRRHVDEQEDIVMGGEAPQQVLQQARRGAGDMLERAVLDDDGASAGAHRHTRSRRTRKVHPVQVDEETQVSRETLRQWQTDYLENCGVKNVRATSAAQARTNAMLLTFGLGIGNVGQNVGIPGLVHPLSRQFSGDSLFTALTGLNVPKAPRGRRRTASEAGKDDEQEQSERRVRPRLSDDADQQGRGTGGQDVIHRFSSPEIGREAQAPMSDQPSSGVPAPWNRGSSAVPGSSIRGSAQKGRIVSSPLGNRGDIQDIVRYSDDPAMVFDDSGLGIGGLQSLDTSFGAELQGRRDDGDEQRQSQQQVPDLDAESRNFLSFMETAVRDHGEHRRDEDFEMNRKWVAFDDVFVSGETARATAAQAFYYVLYLASAGRMYVMQEGTLPGEPFGGIWAGLKHY
ncbi:Rec8 like protein-domain-containing protein [Durotheca rogersii]|uniref:Rec8 like protein-domain-containing protein n=1 Tax=Durotheca rogersii TaxID=419775 RepID=UPI00221EA713|nr:Rec8 like protein-domain-containing protein [Durotheca rogersii]KAI5860723.1 Rec8 like protein-domain-containing protein [Durotheca rogersii]